MTVRHAVRRWLMRWLLPATPPPLTLGVAVVAAVVTLETAGLVLIRAAGLENQPSAPVYALGVLALSTVWGARLGVVAALASTAGYSLCLAAPSGVHLTLLGDLQRFVALALVAVVSGGLANLARSLTADSDTAAEVARVILGAQELPDGLRAGSRFLAARLGLPSASIELGDAPPGPGVIPLGGLGRLVVPPATPPATVDRLRDSLHPALTGILGSAVVRHELLDTLRDSQQATQALLAEQAALRRVATLVAAGGRPGEVIEAVTAELHHLFPGFHTGLLRYEPGGTVTAVSERDEDGRLLPERPGLPIAGENIVGTILRTRRTARFDYDTATGPIAEQVRALGVHRGVGVPIVVEGELWGVTLVLSYQPEPVPADAEARLQAFTELVATAIANAENRARLAASRVRLVTAADDARRRIERDLHDGAQQRIVALALRLRIAEESALGERPAVRQLLSETVACLNEIHQSVSDLARGIHPALLTQGGVCPMLRTLARRSVVPVELRVQVPQRLPERVEVAVYYVVSEALTNVTKHAGASVACVTVTADDRRVWLAVRDDGTGGADLAGGTGLTGLRDRVEALSGRLTVVSPPARGTTLTAEIPLTEPDPQTALASSPMVSAG
ncbi:GAF domain-containing protein [Dactylosporangium sp. AC04546]|uniref:sensor histidine kinase n=1 Tax=Dactylosporangium sp. AC04546 TaxID=2862460 RepID=UPI001EE00A7B|nr:GAF domain-containing protein [Dactylosporangium sp. AC04546]WVK78557.1 GAF domain-containing protein [Dactylosporangium sp. AC04546]